MKLYVISGLGADFKVLEKIVFPPHIEVVFLDWKIPKKDEAFSHYIEEMAKDIDDTEPFCLLGYSFGGMIVQEINKIKPAKKIIILGSIKSSKEKSKLIKLGEITGIIKYLPIRLFNENSIAVYTFMRQFFDSKNSKISEYFRVKDPYYLKWSIQKISEWQFDETSDVVQIMGDKDIVFPIKNSKPNYIIKGGTHLFPITKSKEVSEILEKILQPES